MFYISLSFGKLKVSIESKDGTSKREQRFKAWGKNLCTRQALDQGLVLNILTLKCYSKTGGNFSFEKNVEFLEFFGISLRFRTFQAKKIFSPD